MIVVATLQPDMDGISHVSIIVRDYNH